MACCNNKITFTECSKTLFVSWEGRNSVCCIAKFEVHYVTYSVNSLTDDAKLHTASEFRK